MSIALIWKFISVARFPELIYVTNELINQSMKGA